MMKNLSLIQINQPIGTFFIGKIKAKELLKIYEIKRRSTGDGVQRDLRTNRLNEISNFCTDPDATFPTPIIIAIKDTNNNGLRKINNDFYNYEYDDSERFAEIIDGQHRIEGIKKSEISDDFELIVVLMFNLEEEEKAYIFSTINSNQEKVSKDLIYELFELTKERSPQKTCHEIARIMNSDKESPFFQRLKMLGKKESGFESLSQGTFINYLMRNISKKQNEDMRLIKNGKKLDKDDNLIFRDYFINNQDQVILKVLMNYFNAVKEIFPEEWNTPDKYILCKTTGYGGLMKALKDIYLDGFSRKTLSKEYFISVFSKVKDKLIQEKKLLTSDFFSSGEKGQSDFAKFCISVL